MATDSKKQVDELLADLAAVFDDESTDTEGQPDPESLDELADRADELMSKTDLSELLVASGLGDEDEPPASLPAAVASGDPQNVARLRSVLTASKLATAEDGREEHVDELQSLVATARNSSAETEQTSDAAGDNAESTVDATSEATEATEPEAIEQEASEEATKPEASETEEDGNEESSPIRNFLESQLEDTHGIFEQIPDLEALTGGLNEDDEEKTETTEADDGDGRHEEQSTKKDEEHKDQSTRKSDGTRWRPGGGKQRTTHSTIPGTGRRDIGRRAGRYSSVRGSTVSKR